MSVTREWQSRFVTYGRAVVEGTVKPHSHLMPDLHKGCMDSPTVEEERERDRADCLTARNRTE